MSGEFVLMALVGGLGTIGGPVLGALALIGMETYLASLQDWVGVAQGMVFFVVVLAFREGIVGSLLRVEDRLASRWLERRPFLAREVSGTGDDADAGGPLASTRLGGAHD
jgi:hypothetical protein